MPITINGVVYRNLEDQVAYLTEGYNDLAPISTYLPTDVSSINKLATNSYVDQAVTTVSAHYLTSNASGDNFATKAALLAGPYYYGGVEHTPDENDYAFVNADEDHGDKPARYVYINDSWMFQYAISGVSGVVDLDSAQTITGVKTFGGGIRILANNHNEGMSPAIIDTDVWGTLTLNSNTGTILSNSHFNPSNNNISLGGSDYRWKDLYLSGKVKFYSPQYQTSIYLSGYNLSLGEDHNTTTVAGRIVPFHDNDSDLGYDGIRWKDLYLSGEIIGSYKEANSITTSGDLATAVFNISAIDVLKVKYIEVYAEQDGDYHSISIPVAAWDMTQWTSNKTVYSNNTYVYVMYSSTGPTLNIGISGASAFSEIQVFLKMH